MNKNVNYYLQKQFKKDICLKVLRKQWFPNILVNRPLQTGNMMRAYVKNLWRTPM